MGIDILKFSDYREYLKVVIDDRKAKKKTLSFRQLAQKVGLKSPNYLQMIIKGERSLTPATGERIARVLNISKDEALYFVSMIQKEEARNAKEREDSIRALRMAAKQLTTRYMTQAQEAVLSSWRHLLIREFILLKDFIQFGWKTEFIEGKFKGKTIADFMILPPHTNPTQNPLGSVTLSLLDSQKRPAQSTTSK